MAIAIIASVFAIIVLYVLFASHIGRFFLERKICRMRPPIITFMNHERTYWEEAMRKFNENDRVIRMVHLDDSQMVESLENIKKDLDIDNKYQQLKQKFRGSPRKQVALAHNYVKFLECLAYFRRSSSINASLLTEKDAKDYFETITQVKEKKQYISKIFDELLAL